MKIADDWLQLASTLKEQSGIQHRLYDGTIGTHQVVRLGNGDPLVMLPGMAGGWQLVLPLAERLAAHYEVIIIGFSDENGPPFRVEQPSLGDEANSVWRVIERLGIERPTIMGLSFGGAVALELATEISEAINSLVLTGIASNFGHRMATDLVLHALEHYPLPQNSPMINQFFNLLHAGKPDSRSFADLIVQRCWTTDQMVMVRRLRALAAFDVSDRLWQISVPTLVVAGTRDVIVPSDRQINLARSLTTSSYRQLEGAGHIGFLTDAPKLTRQITRHLKRDHVAQ